MHPHHHLKVDASEILQKEEFPFQEKLFQELLKGNRIVRPFQMPMPPSVPLDVAELHIIVLESDLGWQLNENRTYNQEM